MRTDSNVLVSVGTPLLERASRAVFPASTTIAECLERVARAEPPDPAERRVVQQIRREIGAVRYEILLVMQGGVTNKAQPNQRLGEVATLRDVPGPQGLEKQWVAQLELQAYAPVGSHR